MPISRCIEDFKDCLRYYLFGRKIEVCVVGPEGSGKTAFCRAFISGRFDSRVHSTAGVKARHFKREGLKGTFYDVGGRDNFANLWDFYYRNSDALLFVVSSVKGTDFDQSKEMLRGLLYRNRKINNPILVVCTHSDLEHTLKCKDIALNIGLDALLDRDVACYSVSSVTKSNFDIVQEWLAKNAR